MGQTAKEIRKREPKRWGYVSALKTARHLARRIAEDRGITLRPFQQVHPIESDAGHEFCAEGYHHGRAVVWHPIGEKRIQEARRTCSVLLFVGNYAFGINVYER